MKDEKYSFIQGQLLPQAQPGWPHPSAKATDWLAAHLDDPSVCVVDARWRGDGSGRARYLAGHIPGAIHLDWHADLNYTAGQVRDVLLPPEQFAAVMAAAGIGDESFIVAYADKDYSGAARLWWALRYYGHDQVAVLDGGINQWLAEGRPLSAGEPIESGKSKIVNLFSPRPHPELLATATEIEVALKDPQTNTRLVDTRPPEQFAGQAVWTPAGSHYLPAGQAWIEVEGRMMRGGHIPSAVSLPSSGNLDATTYTYLPPDALRRRALAAGIQPEHRVITYCGVGISASLGLFALHLAGYTNLALYDASWEEWGTDPQRPVNREPPLPLLGP